MGQIKNGSSSDYYNGNDDGYSYPTKGEKFTQADVAKLINEMDGLKIRLGLSLSDSANAPFWGMFATLADRFGPPGSGRVVSVKAGDAVAGNLKAKLEGGAGITLVTNDKGGGDLEVIVRRKNAMIRFASIDTNSNMGSFRTRSVSGSGAFRFNLIFPNDFDPLSPLGGPIVALLGIVSAGAAGTGKTIDMTSEYGSHGFLNETYNNSSEFQSSIFNLVGQTNKFVAIPLSDVMSGVEKDDVVGVLVDHQSIGGSIDYVGIIYQYWVGVGGGPL